MAKRYPMVQIELPQLTCTSTICNSGLHCFKPKKAIDASFGVCRECGFKLKEFEKIDIDVHTAENIDNVIWCLQHEAFRHVYWYHRPLDQKAINYALRKGRIGLKQTVIERLNKSLKPGNPYDGRQTPLFGNPIFFGQHATATCCRKCIEYWYRIPQSRPLDLHEVHFFSELIMTYLTEKLPSLNEEGIYVPPIRKQK